MVLSGILKKTCTSEFFKDNQNCTNPKDKLLINNIIDMKKLCAVIPKNS
jgi:hypothetical protein